ncbi:cytoplasmic phosphatidylinositol transfer protein 1-like protein [Lates japonicus]|uniref:Cytoplasmic phosphatidylinositol transfer protein 1-like protein n=1 Tax=Lates japonicus TaxID=270547 RepID=A0AAD3RF43_LATJO|nr:cytoplasmic phosphatidylinositol transfer protein 1-like protein [Lates japonicus]
MLQTAPNPPAFFRYGYFPQYRIGQLYMISKHSHEQSERGEGVEVVQNEPYEDPEHGSGQFTEKRIYLNNKLPSWARAVVPKIFYVTEKAWNYYPYTITEGWGGVERQRSGGMVDVMVERTGRFDQKIKSGVHHYGGSKRVQAYHTEACNLKMGPSPAISRAPCPPAPWPDRPHHPLSTKPPSSCRCTRSVQEKYSGDPQPCGSDAGSDLQTAIFLELSPQRNESGVGERSTCGSAEDAAAHPTIPLSQQSEGNFFTDTSDQAPAPHFAGLRGVTLQPTALQAAFYRLQAA